MGSGVASVACEVAQSKRIIEFAVGEQTGIGRNDRATEFHHHPAVEIEPQNAVGRFTHRVRHKIARPGCKSCNKYSGFKAICAALLARSSGESGLTLYGVHQSRIPLRVEVHSVYGQSLLALVMRSHRVCAFPKF